MMSVDTDTVKLMCVAEAPGIQTKLAVSVSLEPSYYINGKTDCWTLSGIVHNYAVLAEVA